MLPDQLNESDFDAGFTSGATDEAPDPVAGLVHDDTHQGTGEQKKQVDHHSSPTTWFSPPVPTKIYAKAQGPSDSDIIAAAMNGTDGHTFGRLWNGDASDFGDDREALTQMAYILAPHAGHDVNRIWDILKMSALTKKVPWWNDRNGWPGTGPDGVIKSMQVAVDARNRHRDQTGRDGTEIPCPRPIPTDRERDAEPSAGSETSDPPDSEPDLTDDEVIAAALAADSGGRVREAWEGDPREFPDFRRAQEGFCAVVASLCGGDIAQVTRILKRSKVSGVVCPIGRMESETHDAMERGVQRAALAAEHGDANCDPRLLFPEPAIGELNDKQVLALANNSPDAEQFRRLWAGDASRCTDDREALLALACLVAKVARCEALQVKRIVNESALAKSAPWWRQWKTSDDGLALKLSQADWITKLAIERTLQGTGASGIEWEPPVPFGEATDLPEPPPDLLPDALADFCRQVSHALQTPEAMVVLMVLTLAGAALARKFVAAPREGWEEALVLFSLVVAGSGERKSPLFRLATAHIHEVEADLNLARRGQIAEAAAERHVLDSQLAALNTKAKKASEEDSPELKKKIAELLEKKEQVQAVALCQLVCEDETPEHLVKLMAEQDEKMLLMSAEGTPLEIMKGRYADAANVDVFLKGYSGDYINAGRIGREGNKVEHPTLSMLIMAQPDVIAGLAENTTLTGRGLLARFLFAVTKSKIGRREIAPAPAAPAVVAAYNRVMKELWALGTNAKKYAPCRVPFAPAAEAELRRFEAQIEPRLGPGGDLRWMASLGNKLAGTCVRIATILHFLDTASARVQGGDGPVPEYENTVGVATVARAVQFCTHFVLPHAAAAFGMMHIDKRMEQAKRVVEDVAEKWVGKGPALRPSDIHRLTGRTFKTVKELDPVLDLLVAHGYLRTVEDVNRKPGREYKRPMYRLNPLVFTKA